jgi:hypothetical protein
MREESDMRKRTADASHVGFIDVHSQQARNPTVADSFGSAVLERLGDVGVTKQSVKQVGGKVGGRRRKGVGFSVTRV